MQRQVDTGQVSGRLGLCHPGEQDHGHSHGDRDGIADRAHGITSRVKRFNWW
jgi:hypothetical protein